ncbi:hypothetical protein A3Q56_00226 [Intoshia linei]|uniref:Uncharacterized protein n=1 Tax=Intoshia linei TaxID=1819745 RepID=A0A177BEK2_9BILA|nr:hypothetical protein A3Q56_00226 [Intoshia linei]
MNGTMMSLIMGSFMTLFWRRPREQVIKDANLYTPLVRTIMKLENNQVDLISPELDANKESLRNENK